MKIVDASYEIMNPFSDYMTNEQYFECMQRHIEKVGRTCYKSEGMIKDNSYKSFVSGLIQRGHLAMVEHSSLTVKFTCDRGVSHEIVRHRIASYAQESTRYCNYTQGKFGGEITVIKPFMLVEGTDEYWAWYNACASAEVEYNRLIALGVKPEIARGVLPNSLKTEIIVTMNLREWRHFFELRALDKTGRAHPQIKEVAGKLLAELEDKMPVVFKFEKE